MAVSSAGMRQVAISSDGYVQAVTGPAKPMSFACTAPGCVQVLNSGNPNMCPHVGNAFALRQEVPILWERIKEIPIGEDMKVSVLILEKPNVWIPLKIVDIGLAGINLYGVEAPLVALDNQDNKPPANKVGMSINNETAPIAVIGPGDGILAIRAVFFDLWTAIVAEAGSAKNIKCQHPAHGMAEQSAITGKLRSPNFATRGNELMRQYMTHSCSACAARPRKVVINGDHSDFEPDPLRKRNEPSFPKRGRGQIPGLEDAKQVRYQAAEKAKRSKEYDQDKNDWGNNHGW